MARKTGTNEELSKETGDREQLGTEVDRPYAAVDEGFIVDGTKYGDNGELSEGAGTNEDLS